MVTALRQVLSGEPLPLQKAGKNPGIFPSGKTGKPLADEAVKRGLVEQGSIQPPKAKRGKPNPLYCITSQGQQFVLDQDSPKIALETVQSAIKELAGQLNGLNQPAQGETQFLDQMQEQFSKLFDQVQKTIHDTAEQSRKAIQEKIQKIVHLQQSIQNFEKVVERACTKAAPSLPMASSPPSGSASSDSHWTKEVESYLRTRREAGTLGDCPLPELYNFLRGKHPGLTIGQYHDGLRWLDTENRVRLSGWSGPLQNIPEPDLAMSLAHKVMYYASLP